MYAHSAVSYPVPCLTEELMKKERREEAKRSKQSAKQDSGRDAYDPGSPRDYNPEPKRDERHSQPDADAKSKRMEPQVSWCALLPTVA